MDIMLIDRHFFLSDEEKNYKEIIKNILTQIDSSFEELSFYKIIADEVLIFDHFKEIERQVNLKREEFKESVDNFYLKLIDHIKNFSKSYRDSFRADFDKFKLLFSLKENQSKDILESIFSDPYIPDGFLQRIKDKYISLFYEIQKKIHDFKILMPQKLNKTNSLVSRSITDLEVLFDRLTLTEFSNLDPFNESEILTTIALKYDLNKLCEFSLDQKWKLLYRGSRDGFKPNNFHYKCDNYSHTLTIFKTSNAPYIFGGFASVSWDCSNTYKTDNESFIFSLENQENFPLKLKPNFKFVGYEVSCFELYGPSFGIDDIYYSGYANRMCLTEVGATFSHPNLQHLRSDQIQSLLGGSKIFNISEVEVFVKN